MRIGFTPILLIGAALLLIGILATIYIQSRQGNQQAIALANRILVPILGTLGLFVNVLWMARREETQCPGPAGYTPYIGLGLALLLVLVGLLRYFFQAPPRDRRVIVQPILLALILLTIVFLIIYLGGCLTFLK
ncbi:hypothetical protein EI42_00761 [Thermosporothrix hazakensis]|jgi:uncharacterized membrane protein|uniref:Uncharacterized protein n=1 Tax=Thermosporothrix hazakensis TaxID=644383 RepID=A0A326UVS5_THEHA|nr:hypothetical protein [Thermosporothrix hazakensis]PZW36583.1 hypothetical protein EI42_00761 [Thermosporothrix hazakensis]GCE47234.1 hypothetical protein KTH_21030 [Thermosporothrix hazakensis]